MKNVINNRLYPACHSGDIQAMNAGSSHMHINLQDKMWTEDRVNWLVKSHAHQTQNLKINSSEGFLPSEISSYIDKSIFILTAMLYMYLG